MSLFFIWSETLNKIGNPVEIQIDSQTVDFPLSWREIPKDSKSEFPNYPIEFRL